MKYKISYFFSFSFKHLLLSTGLNGRTIKDKNKSTLFDFGPTKNELMSIFVVWLVTLFSLYNRVSVRVGVKLIHIIYLHDHAVTLLKNHFEYSFRLCYNNKENYSLQVIFGIKINKLV